MNRKLTFAKRTLWILLIPLFMSSCEDKMQQHYDPKPELFEGSIWEVLEKDGNYSTFLNAVKEVGYDKMLQGKALLTVMAPDNKAFEAYLKEHGYASTDDMDVEELKKVVTFHLLYYSYEKKDLMNFRMNGDLESDESAEANKGIYYKFRTKSSDAPTVEWDKDNEKNVTLYHFERFMPVFSHYLFDTRGLNAQSNYLYFYPNSTWNGTEGFNASDASVTEYQVEADNGYIYKVDRVIEPLETIYTEMKKDANYSEFVNLYDRFRTFTYNASISKDYAASAGVDSLFLSSYGTLPNVAQEWPVPTYTSLSTLMTSGFATFAPTNNAMNTLFRTFWGGRGYESWSTLDPTIARYFLQSFMMNTSTVIFPEDITKGELTDSYGNGLSFDPNTAISRKLCSNGTFYGLDAAMIPTLFTTVAGPLFAEKKFRAFTYAMSGSGLLNSLLSQEVKYLFLVANDDQMLADNMMLIEYAKGDPVLSTNETDDGNWGAVSSTTMQNLANIHTASSEEALRTSGVQVVSAQAAYNYWFVEDGKITTSARFNSSIAGVGGDPFSAFHEIDGSNYVGTPWINGHAYSYDDEMVYQVTTEENPDNLEKLVATCSSGSYPFYAFAQLLQKAGVADVANKRLINLYPEYKDAKTPGSKVARFVLFAPTNQAVNEALQAGKIPGVSAGSSIVGEEVNVTVSDKDALAQYLRTFFILSNKNTISVYPYPGSAFRSDLVYQTEGKGNLIYTDNGTNIRLKLEGGSHESTAVSVSSYTSFCFPYAYTDGGVQFIDSVIE